MIRSHSTLIGCVLFIVVCMYVYTIYTRYERFTDTPLPNEIFQTLRNLLDKYDKPEVWNHAIQMVNKSPTELARIQIRANQEK
jgi:hypothetical protein